MMLGWRIEEEVDSVWAMWAVAKTAEDVQGCGS